MSGARSPKSEGRQLLEGWLFDVHPSHDGMIIWMIDDADRPHRLRYRYAPTFYVAGDRSALEVGRQGLARLRIPVTCEPTARRELMSGEQIPVVAVAVHNPLAFPAAARLLARIPGLTLYNCDILTTRLFFYETGLFPLARCALACAGDEAREVTLASRPEDLEYALPPLTVLRLSLESSTANPSHGRPGQLAAGVDGETVVLDGDDPADTIHSLNRLLQRYDPDIVLTEWGDSVLLPRLQDLAARTGIPLQLNRDPTHRARTRRSRSYMTYGQVVYQAGAQMLHGRWHIDLRNSFIYAGSELGGLLEVRRLYYKQRKQATTGSQRASYDQRQTALKWCLVTSFGYLGYRNARFGRIEAHEAVTAFAREMLLRAKEVAESHGFRMLHALVDSMWLQRPGATRADYDALAQAVTGATGLPIFVEGIYRWLAFLPSKTHRGVGVPNRYMGVFENNATKVRGIEVRRSDVPALVVQTQERMLQRMFRCQTLQDVRAALPELLGILEESLIRLRSKDVEAAELVITNTLSQEVGEYRHNTVQAITARTLDRHGAHLHPGEAVQFIITSAGAKVPEDRVRPYALLGSDWHYDLEAYATLLLRAAATVLELFGYSEERLREEVWPLLEQQ